MEKLIELLNECMVECGLSPAWVISGNGLRAKKSYYGEEISEMVIISKKYGFIKRLVDNDKIDRGKFEVEYTDKQTLEDVYIAGAKQDELLIMLLSISDTPIEDLISYLR